MNDGGRITKDHVIILAALLVLPMIALCRFPVDWRWLTGYFAAINILTYGVYVFDKHRARNKGWRIPEKRMHLLELLGGWPAAFVAQRHFRHKSSKGSYQLTFWMIVVIYQWVAFDSINHWRYSQAVWTLGLEYISSQTRS